MSISEMSSRIEHFNSERPTEWASQMKNIDNGFVGMRGKYVLRTRPSWTGVYGKEPWPRGEVWEKKTDWRAKNELMLRNFARIIYGKRNWRWRLEKTF